MGADESHPPEWGGEGSQAREQGSLQLVKSSIKWKSSISLLRCQEEKKLHMDDTRRIEYNRQVIEEFRANGGKVSGWAPLILLTTRGAKLGQTRIYPLMSVPDGDRYIAVA